MQVYKNLGICYKVHKLYSDNSAFLPRPFIYEEIYWLSLSGYALKNYIEVI